MGAALGVELPAATKEAATARAAAYDFAALDAAEAAREEAMRKRLALYRSRFVEGPVLRIPLTDVQISFNPSTLQPFESYGTVYPTLRASDFGAA